MVAAGATAMREAAITERRGNAAAVEHHSADEVVDRGGGDARLDEGDERVEDFGRQPPRLAHAREAGFVVELERAVAPGRRRPCAGGGYGDRAVPGGGHSHCGGTKGG